MIMNPPAEITEATLFFWTGTDNLRRGPVALSQLRNLVRNGTVPKSAQLWCEGWADWVPLSHLAQQLALPMNTQAAVPADILPIKKPRSWLRMFAWSFAWFAMIVCIGLLVIKNLPEETKRAIRDKGIAQEAVLANLPTPRSADFEDIEAKAMKDGYTVVSGTVHAQNAFGAIIRHRFFVELQNGNVTSVKIN